MFARVVTMRGEPEKLDDGIRYFREQILAQIKNLKGFKQSYFMINRQSGKITGMTMWEDEQTLQQSNAIASRVIPGLASVLGAIQAPTVDVLEVAVAEVPTAAGMK
jgi:hypothetical protein